MMLRAFGLAKVPLILFVRPTVEDLTEQRSEVRIPLNFWTRNHLKSMYFGTLAIGADCAGGLLAMNLIWKTKKKISIVFKGFQAEFFKRPEADVHFICEDGETVRKMVEQTIKTGKRVNEPLMILATTPKISGNEPVATFKLILSMKVQTKEPR